MKRPASSRLNPAETPHPAGKCPERESSPRPGREPGPGGLSRQCPAPTSATAPEAASGRRPASRHGALRTIPLPRAARTHRTAAKGEGARDAASYISGHERSPRELVEEGIGLPAEGVALTYLDRRRERRVTVLFPTRPAAEAWAEGREGAAILPLSALEGLAPRERAR